MPPERFYSYTCSRENPWLQLKKRLPMQEALLKEAAALLFLQLLLQPSRGVT